MRPARAFSSPRPCLLVPVSPPAASPRAGLSRDPSRRCHREGGSPGRPEQRLRGPEIQAPEEDAAGSRAFLLHQDIRARAVLLLQGGASVPRHGDGSGRDGPAGRGGRIALRGEGDTPPRTQLRCGTGRNLAVVVWSREGSAVCPGKESLSLSVTHSDCFPGRAQALPCPRMLSPHGAAAAPAVKMGAGFMPSWEHRSCGVTCCRRRVSRAWRGGRGPQRVSD